MDNQYILDILELTGKLLELHGENEFKVRSFNIAVFNLDKSTVDLNVLSLDELSGLQGVGKSMATKIDQIRNTGFLTDLQDLLAKTPEGVVEMLDIKGIGPKKVKTIWDAGYLDSHELLFACENGEISKLKGFGDKIQSTIKEAIVFNQAKQSKLRMNKAAELASKIYSDLVPLFSRVEVVGDVLRKNEEVSSIQILIENEKMSISDQINKIEYLKQSKIESSPYVWRGKVTDMSIPIEIISYKKSEYLQKKMFYSASENHLNFKINGNTLIREAISQQIENEEALYCKLGLPYIVTEMREGINEWEWAKNNKNENLITYNNLKGSLHNHSTYSDGKHTLTEMAHYCKSLGLEYFGIADHSKTAFYAKGLKEEQIIEQHKEIDGLNAKLAPFKILKGIESDILNDGALDYADEVLASFDYVVASVHSNLKMTEEKAMSRLIPAIENPYTTILGHPTGRILLTRNGYPIDYHKVIDACAANGVVIEINASPYRLDLDWRWIYYAMEKGVMLSINPDAHEMKGFHDMQYGVDNARKGGLTKAFTFNALTLTEIEAFLKKKHGK